MSTLSCFLEMCSDIRLATLVTNAEHRDYCRLCAIAARFGDPGFLETRRLKHIRQAYKQFAGDMPEEKWARRLAKWQECDLVEQVPEGLRLTYVIDQEEAEDDGPQAPDQARTPRHNRPLSMSPEAVKKRNQRAGGNGLSSGQYPNGNGQNAHQNGDNAGTSVPQIGDILRDTAGQSTGTSLARVNPNVYVLPKEITKLSSESETYTLPEGTLPSEMSPELSRPGELAPAPILSPDGVREAKKQAVNVIIHDTDDGQQFRGLWCNLWQHCYDRDALMCWNGAVSVLANRLRVGPTPPNLGRWTQGVLKNLLETAQKPYEGKTGPTPAIDPQELADVQRQIRESMGLPLDYAPSPPTGEGDIGDNAGTNVPPVESKNGASAGKTAENVPKAGENVPPMSPPPNYDQKAEKLAFSLGDKRAAPRISRLLALCPPADEQKIVTGCVEMAASSAKHGDRRADYFADHLAGVLRGRKIDVPADLLPAPASVPEPIPGNQNPEGDPDE